MDSGFKQNTIGILQSVVRPAFEMAVEDDIIRKNPFKFKLSDVCLLYTSLLFGQGLPLEIDFIFGDVHSLAGLLFRGIIIQLLSLIHI